MGFKYTDRVYRDVHDTSPTEQLVLLALAHCANDKTGQCFPSVDTLVKRTHLNRSTVRRGLDALKERGLLTWSSGGRKKRGRVLSNLYMLTLPKHSKKAEEESDNEQLEEVFEDVDNSESRGAQCAPYQAHSETAQGRTVSPIPGAQCAPNINITSIDHPGDHNPPPEAAGDKPGRFELGVARRNGTLGDVLQNVIDANEWTRSVETKGLVQLAMEAACTTDIEDRKTFSLVMLCKDKDALQEEIYRFDCERRAGEFQNIRNLPALLTKRLTEVRKDPSCS